MRGRKPKPTLLKDLHGSKKPRNQSEPRIEQALGSAPSYFDGEQCAAWDHAVRHAPPGMLRALDAKMLESWCVASVIHSRAVQELTEQRRLVAPCPRNPAYSVPSPLLGIINRQTAILARLASELGFSPAARPRIRTDSPTQTATELEDRPRMSLEEYLASAPRPFRN
jgi:P27 family predicted phage terminase small subunit